jgi:hypothetical protein
MNNLKWISTVMNMFSKRNSFPNIGMFKKRKNGGTMLYTILGIIASVAITAYGMRKSKPNEISSNPMQSLLDGVQNAIQNTNMNPIKTTLTEFANEITPENGTQSNTNNK